MRSFQAGAVGFLDIADLVERALEAVPAEPLESLAQLLEADGARPGRRRRRGEDGRMSFFVAVFGLLLLIAIHELGHFTAAKATGCARCASTSASRRRW